MNILIGTSLITAFIAGIAALVAPCCITVLLPSYLGSVFKHKRTVFLMTLIFFLGVLVVFLPLGLGFALIGQLLTRYHNLLYSAGALFLIFLGASALLGKHFSLPFQAHAKQKNVKIENTWSVFVLGIFSGFATLCCAPVLAGVMALSALPGSIFWGGTFALVYALGMVMPLFVIAYFLDKSNLTNRFAALNKPVRYSLLGQEIRITSSELIAGAMYLLMGILILYLTWTNQLAMNSSGYGTSINIFSAKLTAFLQRFLAGMPSWLWLIIILVIMYLVLKIAVGSLKGRAKADSGVGHECCQTGDEQ